MSIQVGNTVIIAESSEYYTEDSEVNPRGMSGIVTNIDEDFREELGIEVQWENGIRNDYSESDLEIVE